MELKWLEDLITVAEMGHFSRAADARFVTQSALSRRIKSLENWLGVELLDRSHHPISLTTEGRDFIATAREIVAQSYHAQQSAMAASRIADTGVRVACLHTLALYFLPSLFADLRKKIGPFEISTVAETRTVDEYLDALSNGGSDFFICYSHPSVPFDIDPEKFPSKTIGVDVMKPYQHNGDASNILLSESDATIPFLEFSSTSYMSHVVRSILASAPKKPNLKPVFRASLAESLYTAAQHDLGIAWLPQSIIHRGMPNSSDEPANEPWSTTMKINIYRSERSNTGTVEAMWEALG